LELNVWNVDENNLCCFNEFLNFFFLPENVNDDGCILLHPKNVPPFLASFVVLKKRDTYLIMYVLSIQIASPLKFETHLDLFIVNAGAVCTA
jgi:hypothetical protein